MTKWKSDIEENTRSGIVELLILQLLSEEDMYGYQIKQELAKRTDGAFIIKEGSFRGQGCPILSSAMITLHGLQK